MKRLYVMPLLLFAVWLQLGCEKYADDYKKYLENKEIVYPGLAQNVRYYAGEGRTMLVWNPSPDPHISHYEIVWNNGDKKMKIEATTHNPTDSMRAIVPELAEYVYSFTIISFDKEGNTSIGQQIHNVRVYGPNFRSILLNRLPDLQNPYDVDDAGQLRLKFLTADSMNITTRVSYENRVGQRRILHLPAQEHTLVLPDYKYGTAIQYRSGYAPEPNAIDTIYSLEDAYFPPVLRPVDKAKFGAISLPNDAGTAWGWVLPNLWNNSYDEPGYHSADVGMPASFTIDMGTQYSLSKIKLWQRMSSVYDAGNPKVLEIWGSNNPSADGSWDSWSNLGRFTILKPSGLPQGQQHEDDIRMAKNGHDLIFEGQPAAVRYLRFKVLETWGGNNFIHIIEITPYSKD